MGKKREWFRRNGVALVAIAVAVLAFLRGCGTTEGLKDNLRGDVDRDIATLALADLVQDQAGQIGDLEAEIERLRNVVELLPVSPGREQRPVTIVREVAVPGRDPDMDKLAKEVGEARREIREVRREVGDATNAVDLLGNGLRLVTVRVDKIDKPDGEMAALKAEIAALREQIARAGCVNLHFDKSKFKATTTIRAETDPAPTP